MTNKPSSTDAQRLTELVQRAQGCTRGEYGHLIQELASGVDVVRAELARLNVSHADEQTVCMCGSANPKSARFGSAHLLWCAFGEIGQLRAELSRLRAKLEDCKKELLSYSALLIDLRAIALACGVDAVEYDAEVKARLSREPHQDTPQ